MNTDENNKLFFGLVPGSQLKEVHISTYSLCVMQELMRVLEERKLRTNRPMDGIKFVLENDI